jgi:CheY-like chemotaxis protein
MEENLLSAGRILVIDDEPQIRRLMRTTLISAGYEVDDARTGEEGLEKIGDYHPDLVLLDINMPGMGGLATCEALRADKNIAIIMLTVRDSEADKVAALDAGADDFVTKHAGAFGANTCSPPASAGLAGVSRKNSDRQSCHRLRSPHRLKRRQTDTPDTQRAGIASLSFSACEPGGSPP